MADLKKEGRLSAHQRPVRGNKVGGNKKVNAKPESNSRTADKQNAGGGFRNLGTDD